LLSTSLPFIYFKQMTQKAWSFFFCCLIDFHPIRSLLFSAWGNKKPKTALLPINDGETKNNRVGVITKDEEGFLPLFLCLLLALVID